MKNVYDAVKSFYAQDPAWEDIIKYNLVEGFLRQKAWQHTNDADLNAMWEDLVMFGLYLAYADIYVHQMNNIDYDEMVAWLERNVAEFNMEYPSVKKFFKTLLEFQNYLVGRKIVETSDNLSDAINKITADGTINIHDVAKYADLSLDIYSETTPDAPVPIYLKLDEHLQELLLLLNKFYQKAEYIADFERAIFLYHGVMGWEDEDLETRQHEFWLGFWDYFLCDYRLLQNDKTPLQNFHDVGSYPDNTRLLLKDLMNARFTVFFVKNPSNEEWVECEDLFTGRSFYLPNPGENPSELKDFLFIGHLFSQNMVLVNYVMSVQVSLKLRSRIKDEVKKQFDFYLFQEPNSTWEKFLQRHAIAVRHTIEIFTTFSKLNAVTAVTYPTVVEQNDNFIDVRVVESIITSMSSSVFSYHDQRLALRMWFDYSRLATVRIRKPELWASGIVANFVDLNSAFEVDYDYIASIFDLSIADVKSYQRKVAQVLHVEKHDLRYLNEEGFVMLLMNH